MDLMWKYWVRNPDERERLAWARRVFGAVGHDEEPFSPGSLFFGAATRIVLDSINGGRRLNETLGLFFQGFSNTTTMSVEEANGVAGFLVMDCAFADSFAEQIGRLARYVIFSVFSGEERPFFRGFWEKPFGEPTARALQQWLTEEDARLAAESARIQ